MNDLKKKFFLNALYYQYAFGNWFLSVKYSSKNTFLTHLNILNSQKMWNELK